MCAYLRFRAAELRQTACEPLTDPIMVKLMIETANDMDELANEWFKSPLHSSSHADATAERGSG